LGQNRFSSFSFANVS